MRKIPVCEPLLGDKELEYVTDCIKTGWISSKGKYIDEFEKKFSEFCGVRHGITTTSGTTAIHLALAAIGIKPGDDVIMPDFTMIATANPIYQLGARPVFIDSDMETWCIDPTKIEEKITKKTKAILVVHMYGHPCDMDPINEIAKRHGVYVIEDAAESHGAEYRGKKTGSLGDIGCFSFYANKIITTGEGGMVITDNDEIAEKCRLMKDLAFEKKRFFHRFAGYNFRMTNLQAAVGVGQMYLVEKSIETRRRNAKLYNSLLKGVRGIITPPEASWAKNVYWMYTILVDDSFGISRDNLVSSLAEKGVETRTTFFPMHVQPVFKEFYKGEQYPNSDFLGRTGINLPSGNTLTKDDIEYVVEVIKSSGE